MASSIPFKKQLRSIARLRNSPEMAVLFSIAALLASAWPTFRSMTPSPELRVIFGNGNYQAHSGGLRVALVVSNEGNRDAVLLDIDACTYGADGKFCSGDRKSNTTPTLPLLVRAGQILTMILTHPKVAEEQLVQSPMQTSDSKLKFLGLNAVSFLPGGRGFRYTFPFAQMEVLQTRGGFEFIANGLAFRETSHDVLQNGTLEARPQRYTNEEVSAGLNTFEVFQTKSTFDGN